MSVYNGDFCLKQVLASIYPFAHEICITEGPVSFYKKQGFDTSWDNTNYILETFPDPDRKIKVLHSQWREKDEQTLALNEMIDLDTDYLWWVSCDEVYKHKDIEAVVELMKVRKPDSIGFKWLCFFGGFNHIAGGFDEKWEQVRVFRGNKWVSHRPLAANIPGKNHMSWRYTEQLGIFMYHYTYVWPRQMRDKMAYYENLSSRDDIIPNYFEDVFRPWVQANDSQRKEIEKKYQGVHPFKPKFRTPSYTYRFTGEHPKVMEELI